MNLHASDYVHLHLHTEASALDGAIRPSELPKKVHSIGQIAVAVTDHGVLSSTYRVDEAVKKYNKENDTNLKFIPGLEGYFVPDRKEKDNRNYHLTLLAKDADGYSNLMRLNNNAWMSGFYYKPRMDWELLELYHTGIICLSGCIAGPICSPLVMQDLPTAWDNAKRLKDLFGDDFYVEYHDHGLEDQQKILPELLQIAKNLKLKVVASNDCHYTNQSDFKPHEVLLATQTGTPIFLLDSATGERTLNPRRFSYEVPEFYVKSTDEMLLRIPPEYLITSREIAEKSNVQLEYERKLAPQYPVPGPSEKDARWESWYRRMGSGSPEKLSDDYLAYQALRGFHELGYDDRDGYKERFKKELEIIWKYGFSDLILVVWDYMKWAKENGIRTGPRGSAAGSLIVHCLGISDPACDPIEYGLLFERFINEDRVQPPDIDVDFETGGRDRVLDYISERYGIDKVASIGTRSILHITGAVRDTARALGLPYEVQNRISKELEPWANEEDEIMLSVGLEEVVSSSPYLTKLYEEYPELFDLASRIQGLQRQSGRHAAGAVVSKYPLVDTVPLMVRDGKVITQVDMFDVEHLGLLKVDLLGLKSLSVIGKTIELIKEKKPDAKIELKDIPKDDSEVYRFIRERSGLGLFQVGTRQMQEYCRRLPLRCIDDIAQLIAAYRPSTARAGVTEEYVKAKEGKTAVDTYHPLLREVLLPTAGKMIYQEQVIDVFMLIAGYTRSQADNVRRIMGKMLGEAALAVHKEAFFKGGVERGLPNELLKKIWHDLEKFSIYGFNKSHSVAYALICYQTAYFKLYYPTEFYTACLCFEDDKLKFRAFLYEAKQVGIQVKGPDINASKENFSIDRDGCIRFGLSSVKNVGSKSVVELVKHQPYSSFDELLKRVNRTVVNVRVLEFLIKAGAMDSFCLNPEENSNLLRNELLREIRKHDGKDHQNSYYEAEALGESLLNHPIDRYSDKLERFGFVPIAEAFARPGEISCAGIVANIRTTMTKRNEEMAFVKLADQSATCTVICWPDKWSEVKDVMHQGRCIAIRGSRMEDQELTVQARLAKEVA